MTAGSRLSVSISASSSACDVVCRQVVREREHADASVSPPLVAHVDLRRRVFTDEHDSEPGRRLARRTRAATRSSIRRVQPRGAPCRRGCGRSCGVPFVARLGACSKLDFTECAPPDTLSARDHIAASMSGIADDENGRGVERAIRRRLERELARPLAVPPAVVEGATAGWLDDARAARGSRLRRRVRCARRCDPLRPATRRGRERTAALERVARALAATGKLTAWRDERYAVAPDFGAPPWFLLERAAARYFGIRTWAAHVNGLVRAPKA